MMKPLLFISAAILLTLVSCSTPDSSNEEKKTIAPAADSYFPLAVGSTWYYTSYQSVLLADTGKITSSWQVVSKTQVGGNEFYGVRRVTYGKDTTVILTADTTYYSVHNDSLFQIEPGMPLAESSIHLQAVFCESGYATFTWNSPGGVYEATLNGRTDKTLTYYYWMPEVNVEGYSMTFQKGVGCYDMKWERGAGRRLVKHVLKTG